jgi:hypothetical protein
MRRTLASFGLAIVLGATLAGGASAHVHGITPLNCVGVADDGAFATDGTAADDANGGPLTGLIPRDTGEADFITSVARGDDTPVC